MNIYIVDCFQFHWGLTAEQALVFSFVWHFGMFPGNTCGPQRGHPLKKWLVDRIASTILGQFWEMAWGQAGLLESLASSCLENVTVFWVNPVSTFPKFQSSLSLNVKEIVSRFVIGMFLLTQGKGRMCSFLDPKVKGSSLGLGQGTARGSEHWGPGSCPLDLVRWLGVE